MICKEEKVKWWQVINETMHVFLKEDYCIEDTGDVYGDLNGIKIILSKNLFKETTWNWALLSESEKKEIKSSYLNDDIFRVIEIHNKYSLSGMRICCESHYMNLQLELAIKNNWI